MSDEEYQYEYGSDAEYNYGSDGGDAADPENEVAIEIENSFYEADDFRLSDPKKALELFLKVVDLETTHRPNEVTWRFKALQHMVTLYCKMGQMDVMIQSYKNMLQFVSNPNITRNECTDAINSVLDSISSSVGGAVLSEMYEITLQALKVANNERLWFNTNLKLARLYLEGKHFQDAERLISDLKKSCQRPDGTDDVSKGTSLLEVYSLEIQLCTLTLNRMRMRDVYPKTLKLNSAISDPRIMGVIREEGGKMYMAEENWIGAYNEFYEAFIAYQEAGNSRAKDCLKYVVLASILSLSDINPFSAREAKVYAEDREILAMSELRTCLEDVDLPKFERVLKDKRNRILDEPYLMKYIQPLRKRMREQVLLSITRPYSKVTFEFLVDELLIPREEVEALLVEMVLDKRIAGQIDQLNSCLVLERSESASQGISDHSREYMRLADLLVATSDQLYASTYV